jgi:DME family drug/metabolite transporter
VVGAIRLIVGSSLLLALVVYRRSWRHRLVRSLRSARELSWLSLAAIAAAAYQTAFFSSVARTGVLLGTVVAIGAAPVFTGLTAAAIGRERPSRRWLAATVIAVVGAAILLWPTDADTIDSFGIMLAVAAGLCYGLYTNSAKELLRSGMPPVPLIAGSLALAALFLSPVVIRDPPSWLADPSGLLMTAWLGVAATAGAYVLFASGLQQLPAATVGTLGLVEPLTAATLGVVALGERPTARAATGAALIFVGLLLVTLRAKGFSPRETALSHGDAQCNDAVAA